MSPRSLCLCFFLILGLGLAADIPCGYNESGFHDIASPDTPTVKSGPTTLSAPSQDQSSSMSGVPRISDPSVEVKSNIDLIEAAVDPENTITRNKAVEIASDAPGPYNIDQICYLYKYLKDNWEYVSDPRASTTSALGTTP